MDQPAAQPLKWYQGLEKYCWIVLVISALGWLFDTMDQNLFNLVRKTSMEDLLMPKEKRQALTGDEKIRFNDDVQFPISKPARNVQICRTDPGPFSVDHCGFGVHR